jgi:uncharacterized SAM-binding protein YcdF (DUF218 family)
MFFIKKIVSRLFFPLSLILECIIIGLLWPKKGKKFLLSALVLLYLFSFHPFANLLLWPLERSYAPIPVSSIRKDIRTVVVLGGGAKENRSLTPEDRLSDASLKRLLEGIRICRHLPEARLILSGGDYHGATPVAGIMNEVAMDHGVAPSRLVLEESSRDTREQARLLSIILGPAPFYLVTSANHMPRSMALFRKVATRPVAAPTDFPALWEPFRVTTLFPQAGALGKTESAFYEYLGLLWGWVWGDL